MHLYIMAQIIFIFPFSTLVIIVECLVGVTGLGGTTCFNADHCYLKSECFQSMTCKDYLSSIFSVMESSLPNSPHKPFFDKPG